MKSPNPHSSSSRISLENAKTKTWHPGWIALLLLVLAGIAIYATVRVLRHGIVSPVKEVGHTLELQNQQSPAPSP